MREVPAKLDGAPGLMDLKPHIEKFRQRFAEVETLLSDPKTFSNNLRFQELSREYARLKELVAIGQVYLKIAADLADKGRMVVDRRDSSTAINSDVCASGRASSVTIPTAVGGGACAP